MTQARQHRALRASAAATLATFVALMSHVAAGGDPPAVLGVVLPWSLSLLASLLLVGRRLSLVRLSAAVVAAQALFHVVFALGIMPAAPAVGAAAGDAPAAGGGHAGHMSFPASLGSDASALPAHLAPDLAMVLAHAAAAVITIAALHRAERLVSALLAVARRIAVRLRAVLGGIISRPMPPAPARPRSGGRVARHPRPLIAAPALRGPPALFAS
ncbi:hypothetical protein [Microbacterium radiodurans]|uniref:Uncharacterized protein n=1 Tax=Microbacterium radiodurans TaxID=661398 RepID=A0A5J5IUG0_9MICO|nr:hypothetical protein [Microbacterium radiodurans]KAA9089764.1 hypothetical protein F6B42_04715 [Microbacterium radiodurans]